MSSSAMTSVTEKISTVVGLMSMRSRLITPSVSSSGNRFGTSAIAAKRSERSTPQKIRNEISTAISSERVSPPTSER